MKLRIAEFFKKFSHCKTWQKVLLSFVCIILVITISFIGCGIPSSLTAHAAIEAVEPFIIVILSLLTACGVTCTTDIARDFAKTLPSSLQTSIENSCDNMTAKGMVLNFVGSWWLNFFAKVVLFFGPHAATAHSNAINISEGQSISSFFDERGGYFDYVDSSYSSAQIMTCKFPDITLNNLGFEYCKNLYPDVYTKLSSLLSNPDAIINYTIVGTGIMLFTATASRIDLVPDTTNYENTWRICHSSVASPLTSGDYSYVGYYHNSFPVTHSTVIKYNNTIYHTKFVTDNWSFQFFDDSGKNLVCDGAIGNTSVPNTVCDNVGTFTQQTWQNFVCDVNIGKVNIQSKYYPGVDTYPATGSGAKAYPGQVAYPDTDVAIPGSADGLLDGTVTPADVRSGDLDDVQPDTQTGTDTDDDSEDKKTPKVPKAELSLPEIIFKEKFPFCLPWDVYNLFSGLEQEGKPPKFTIPFKFDKLGIHESFTIDFSQFEEQIKIIRFFLGASFVLALILISRKLIGSE